LKDEDTNEIVFDSVIVASKFNNFFCNIASKLVEKLPKREFEEKQLLDFYQQKNVMSNSFSFTVVSEDEVFKLLSSLNTAKSTGCDNISARFVKEGAVVLCTPLSYIINLSLTKAIVPSDFKMARVVPLFKKGSRSCEGNYRPVSILPVISKIFEKVVYKQFYKYLSDNDVIYKFQSGFRSSFSTDTALTYMCDKIRFDMDKGLYTGLVLLDLQKAFDTVDHQILLKKLSAVGANNFVVNWFSSYISERQQVVQVNGSLSTPMSTSCGVPQGSILGPLLFLIYVNDMSKATSCDLYLYADDSALLVSGCNVNEIEEKLSLELENVKMWLEENKLSLHLGKTESILFGSKKKLKKVSTLDVKCNGVTLVSKSNVKYLGATLDQDLGGTSMGLSAVKKINSGLKFLYRKAEFLKSKERKLICTALLQSKFDYGCNMWFRCVGKSIRDKLQTAQNKIIRYILDYEYRQHLDCRDFKKVNFLNVQNRIDYLSLNMMYKIFNNTAPSYMSDYIPRFAQSHCTRNSVNSFEILHVKTHGSRSFKFNGVKLWNSLPNYIKCAENKDTFKYKCKQYLTKKMVIKENAIYV